MDGHSIDDLFLLQNCKTRRAASDDKTGGNHDWLDLPAGEIKTFAQLEGCGIVRHIWMTHWTGDENWTEEPLALRKLVLRIYWDDEQEPSVEVPLGDFFGIGFGMRKCFSSAALQMNPE
ncbi:MAG: DUF2961 domain-containing protein, partial [Ruthenibacterium sp.]